MRKLDSGIVEKEDNKGFIETWTDEMVKEFYDFMYQIDLCIANFIGRMVKDNLPIGTYTKFNNTEEKYFTYIEDEFENKICEPGVGKNISESVKNAWINYSEYLKEETQSLNQ